MKNISYKSVLLWSFVGLFGIFLPISIWTYISVTSYESEAFKLKQKSRSNLKMLTVKYRDRIRKIADESNDNWSGLYVSPFYGVSYIAENNGFYLRQPSQSCMPSSYISTIGKLKKKDNFFRLTPYKITYMKELPLELTELVPIKHNEERYLVPRIHLKEFFLKLAKRTEGESNPRSYYNFFAKQEE